MAGDDEEEDEEVGEDQPEGEESKKSTEQKTLKRSVINLNLADCTIIDRIEEPSFLHKFDMNKVIDSDDEYNTVKRRARTKA